MKTITCIWADDLASEADAQHLRCEVDHAMGDPNHIVVTNFPISSVQLQIPEAGDVSQGPRHQCCGGNQMPARKTTVAIVAPRAKTEELPALQKQIEEAIAGPKHYFVTNQPLDVCVFEAPVDEAKPE